VAVAAVAALGLGMATAQPAGARTSTATGTLPPALVRFEHCPINDPAVTACLYSKATSTTFEIGSTTVTTTKPTTVSLGLAFDQNGNAIAVLPDDGTQALN
jgi:hypothetical protein